jgi:predicted secreted protein
MTTVAYPGYGSKLETSAVLSPASWAKVAQLKKFNFSGLSADFDEITNLDSPTIFKEWMKTTVDGKDLSMDGVMNPNDSSMQSLLTNLATAGSAALVYWKITLTDGSTLVFAAFVSDFSFGVEYNKAITFSAKLKIVGDITPVWV